MQAIPTIDTFIDFKETKEYTFKIELNGLIPDVYSLSTWIGPHNNETYYSKERMCFFDIINSPTKGRTFPHTEDHGFIVPASKLLVNDQSVKNYV